MALNDVAEVSCDNDIEGGVDLCLHKMCIFNLTYAILCYEYPLYIELFITESL